VRNVYKVLVKKPEGRSFVRPRHRWEDNIRMDLTEMGWQVVSWIHLPQERDQWQDLVNTETNLQV
jgi:hypothetical protein